MSESKENYEKMSSKLIQQLSYELIDISQKWGSRFALKRYGFENMCVFQTKN